MAKEKSIFLCNECGYESPKWAGKCPSCGAWNSFAEKVVREIDTKKAQGIGVFTVDGKMIDIAFYDGAKRTLALARASGVYKGDL